MDTLGDLVARDRRSDRPAIRAPAVGRAYSYRDLCTTAAKAGNLLRYVGVRGGDRVAVADDPRPEPVVTFLGAALLGAVTRVGVTDGEAIDARAVIASHDRESSLDLPPGSRLVVYGGPPSSPAVAHWERDVWSENPTFPPGEIEPTDPALAGDGGATQTHAGLLGAARSIVEEYDLDADDVVAVRASASRPGVVVAGIVAPLLANAAILFPDGETAGTVAVADDDAPEPIVVRPDGW